MLKLMIFCLFSMVTDLCEGVFNQFCQKKTLKMTKVHYSRIRYEAVKLIGQT